MIDTYQGGAPSTRYRDLVDLVLIATTHRIDAGDLRQALLSEYAFRGLDPPRSVELPDPSWVAGYQREAQRVPGLIQRRAADGLNTARALLGPVLEGRETGTWNPVSLQWDDTTGPADHD